MGDHGEPAKAQQVAAAVGVRVEPSAETPGRGADQQPAELSLAVAVISSRSASSRPRMVPSSSFSATLPVNPSVTTTPPPP